MARPSKNKTEDFSKEVERSEADDIQEVEITAEVVAQDASLEAAQAVEITPAEEVVADPDPVVVAPQESVVKESVTTANRPVRHIYTPTPWARKTFEGVVIGKDPVILAAPIPTYDRLVRLGQYTYRVE